MIFNIVKLAQLDNAYLKCGLTLGAVGIILEENQTHALVMFFNSHNQGDYLVATVKKDSLQQTEHYLPADIAQQLAEKFATNGKKLLEKTTFTSVPFSLCDQVELVVEKESYARFGVHKGARGTIAVANAVKGKVLVDFGNATESFDGFVSVDFKDLVKTNG